jgi:hypothetical protein
MEVIATITLPQVLQLGYDALCFAWNQYNAVEERKAQCMLLMERCRDLLADIAEKSNRGHLNDAMKDNVHLLERCILNSDFALQAI